MLAARARVGRASSVDRHPGGTGAGRVAGAGRRTPARARAGVPPPLHGVPLTGRTGLRLLVSADPPFVLERGLRADHAGHRGQRRRSACADACSRWAATPSLWVDSRSGPSRPGSTWCVTAAPGPTRIGTASELAPADRGHGLWLIGDARARRRLRAERGVLGRARAAPRRVGWPAHPGWSRSGPPRPCWSAGHRVIAPDTGRTLLRASWLWAIAGRPGAHQRRLGAAADAGQARGRPVRRLCAGRAGSASTDDADAAPGGRLIALDFGDPAYRLTATQIMDAWLLDLLHRTLPAPAGHAGRGRRSRPPAWRGLREAGW